MKVGEDLGELWERNAESLKRERKSISIASAQGSLGTEPVEAVQVTWRHHNNSAMKNIYSEGGVSGMP